MNWPELADLSLLDDSTKQLRVDLITRALHSRYEHQIKLKVDDQVFGKVVAHVSVIKWQKRGLPHCHMIV